MRAYAQDGCEQAFESLVARHVDLVYATALRRANGDTHKAEDAAQIVFTDLAKKARSLPPDVRLSGWLHRHVCFVVSNLIRSEQRRLNRENTALEMHAYSTEAGWNQLAPVVDEAIEQLEASDRDAIMLRFFERCDLSSVGAALGINADAAQKRVSRALDKLRVLLAQEGVVLSATALMALLATQSQAAAPAGLAASLARTALHAPAAAGAAASVLKLLTAAKIKFVLGAVAVALLFLPYLWSRYTQNLSGAAPSAHIMGSLTPSNSNNPQPPKKENTVSPVAEAVVTAALNLEFVALYSGKPIPNVSVEYWGWADRKFTRKDLMSNRLGFCEVDFPKETTKLELYIRTDGFADSCLKWQPEHGSKIPGHYTVKMERPIQIGGSVAGPDAQPVAGARVGFGFSDYPQLKTEPESHEFRNIEVLSDAEGRWRLNRIAPDMIPYLVAVASHPRFTESQRIKLAVDSEPLQQLREETYQFILGPAADVTGLVVDAGDKPIANASVLIGPRDVVDSRESSTAADGSFSLAGCKLGESSATAMAAGYAAKTVPIDITADMKPLKLVLSSGKLLLIRILNTAGKPIPKARVFLNVQHRNHLQSPNQANLQAEFAANADDDGLVSWSDAPDMEMVFDCFASGFMRADNIKLRPDAQEHVITMKPAVTISGAAVDASSNLPIEKFQMICGFPDEDGNPRWSLIDRHWISFVNGQFKYTLEEPIVLAKTNPGYLFKFVAEGYVPVVTRAIQAHEGEVRLEIKMKPTVEKEILVLRTDGRPAIDFPVAFVSKGSQLLMSHNGMVRNGSEEQFFSVKTDAKGCFKLPEDPSIVRVMAVHAEGIADLTPVVLFSTGTLQLQKWARLEGTYHVEGNAATGRSVYCQLGQGSFSTVFSSPDTFVAKVDNQGRFVFAKAPPGTNTLIWREPEPGAEEYSHYERALSDVNLLPGETNLVTVRK